MPKLRNLTPVGIMARKLSLQVRDAGLNPVLVHFHSSCACFYHYRLWAQIPVSALKGKRDNIIRSCERFDAQVRGYWKAAIEQPNVNYS